MKALICGSRDFSDPVPIQKVIDTFSDTDVVIHGAAPGADTLAGILAEKRGLKVLAFPADWKKYGRAAGPIRNKQMLVEGMPDRVYAFYSDKKASKGTANMVMQANRAKVPVVEFECSPGLQCNG